MLRKKLLKNKLKNTLKTKITTAVALQKACDRHAALDTLAPHLKQQCTAKNYELLLTVLQTAAMEGADQGTTILWVIAAAATEGHSAALHALIPFLVQLAENDHNQFLALLQAADQDKNTLWLISAAAINGHPDTLQALLPHLGKLGAANSPDPLLRLLQQTPTTGPDQGTNALWAITVAAVYGNLLARQTLHKFLKQLLANPEALLTLLQAAPTTGSYQGKTILWLVSAAAVEGYSTALQALVPFLEQLATADDPSPLLALLQTVAAAGATQGKTILWVLTVTAIKGYPAAFQALLPFLEKLATANNPGPLLELLQAAPTTGSDQGRTILWVIATAARSYPVALKTLLPFLKKLVAANNPELLLKLLQAAPTAGSTQGKTVFWFIAAAAAKDQLVALQMLVPFLRQLAVNNHDQLLALLQVAPLATKPHQDKSILWLITVAAARNNPAALNALIPCLIKWEPQLLLDTLGGEPQQQNLLLSSLFAGEKLERYHFLLAHHLPQYGEYNEDITDFLRWFLDTPRDSLRYGIRNHLISLRARGYTDICLFMAHYLLEHDPKETFIAREVLNLELQQDGTDRNTQSLFLHGHTFYLHATTDQPLDETRDSLGRLQADDTPQKREALLKSAFLSLAKVHAFSTREDERKKAEYYLTQILLTHCHTYLKKRIPASQKLVFESLLHYFNYNSWPEHWSLDEAGKFISQKMLVASNSATKKRTIETEEPIIANYPHKKGKAPYGPTLFSASAEPAEAEEVYSSASSQPVLSSLASISHKE